MFFHRISSKNVAHTENTALAADATCCAMPREASQQQQILRVPGSCHHGVGEARIGDESTREVV